MILTTKQVITTCISSSILNIMARETHFVVKQKCVASLCRTLFIHPLAGQYYFI